MNLQFKIYEAHLSFYLHFYADMNIVLFNLFYIFFISKLHSMDYLK